MTFISENISAIAGYRAGEFLSNPDFWVDLIHPEDRERAISGLIEVGDRGYVYREYRLRHISGMYLWIRDDMKLMRDENNLRVEIVGSWSDISERKLA
ncbi:PAS domain-containing protein [Oscillatoria sp. HE19RPO]|uniref:PAS domain-containing protein n=1 Tax=Oscillatoria sp. HE19RPO TaxID=2954806 RepID=UPI002811AB17|nr:PAS domain-containing protein [Oscillatoria sp. HE19RPO]